MLNFYLCSILRIQSGIGYSTFYLSLLGGIGILVLLWIAVFRWENFLFFMLTIKPFIDMTVNAPIFGFGNESEYNALEISGIIIFIVLLFKYSLMSKSGIYNQALIWLFISLHVISFSLAWSNGEQTSSNAVKFFIKLLDGYFIYFVASKELMKDCGKREKIYRNIWFGLVIANVISIMAYQLGFSNFDTTRGFVRYDGLYNDPGTPSYLSVICLLFANLFRDTTKEKYNNFLKILYYFSWATTLFVLIITLTKSALFLFIVFLLMWYGVYKRKMILIIPAIAIGIAISFSLIPGMSTRFETEQNFVESDYDQDVALSMGTGRVGRWENLMDMFYNKFDLQTQLIGASRNFAAHNQYLAYLLQVGIIGLTVFIIIVLRFYSKLIGIYAHNHNPEIFAGLTLLTMYSMYNIFGHAFDTTTLLWYLMILLSLLNINPVKIRIVKQKTLGKIVGGMQISEKKLA